MGLGPTKDQRLRLDPVGDLMMGLGPTEDQRLRLGLVRDLTMGLGPTEDQRSNDGTRPYERSKDGSLFHLLGCPVCALEFNLVGARMRDAYATRLGNVHLPGDARRARVRRSCHLPFYDPKVEGRQVTRV
ncbi:hypothetical protein CRG98_018960 [Punica granatum]|uniref:Uncharacterized protein n=1 Tax=Punica granatum TaxID=22663 RepID=A0A2I0JWK4_PUNGR|nr:hypothetical protein CRG98_018960 [Punica granatum]